MPHGDWQRLSVDVGCVLGMPLFPDVLAALPPGKTSLKSCRWDPPGSISPGHTAEGSGATRGGDSAWPALQAGGAALPHSCSLRAWLAGWDGPSPSTGRATCPRLLQGCCQQLPRLCWKLGWPPPLGKEVCRWRSCRGCHGPEAPPQRSRRASCTRLRAALCLLAHSWAGLVHGARCSWALHRVGQLCQGCWRSGHMMSLPLSETWSWVHTREAGLGSSAPRAMCMALSKLEQLAAGSAAPHPACAVRTLASLTGESHPYSYICSLIGETPKPVLPSSSGKGRSARQEQTSLLPLAGTRRSVLSPKTPPRGCPASGCFPAEAEA